MATNHDIKAGDIFYSSWGYDQTNVDYYIVTRVVGRCSVELQEIGTAKVETIAPGIHRVKPDPSVTIGAAFTKRVNEYAGRPQIRMASHANAYRVQPDTTQQMTTYA
jgi:hypothetical protein